MKNDTLFSKMIRGSSRNYFLDVYEGETGKRLSIKETRMMKGERLQQQVIVFEEDMPEFIITFLQTCGSFEMPDGFRERIEKGV